jgi:cell division protein FtsI (penicillin-binding protein 3)
MLGRTDSRRRLILVLAVFVVASTLLVGRLAFWQVVQHDRLAGLAAQQTMVQTEEPSHRGTIYDRTGTVVLATTVDRSRLDAAPSQLTPDRRTSVAAALVAALGLRGQAATDLTAKMTSDKAYVILEHGLDSDAANRIRDGLASGDIAAVSLEPEPVRVYPQQGGSQGTSLAAQLLGFVNSAGVGQYGVEQYYQSTLAGRPTVLLASRDASGEVTLADAEVKSAGTPGVDMTLTVDAGMQLALEQELLAAGIADRAKSVSAVVMDPYTGAVYAEATYPSYDANQYQAIAAKNPGRFVDPVISSVYEPGSVFKMMTAVATLERGVIKPTTPIDDSGILRLDGGSTWIADADRHAMGVIPFQDVIAYSRNVGAAKAAMRLGNTPKASKILFSTWEKLGFGQKTGIDLAGEVAGLVNNPAVRPWRQIDLANGSFGQGIAVTPMQLAQAYSAMVNGGVLIQPHVVATIGGQNHEPNAKAQVIPKKLSPVLTRILNHVPETVPFYRDRTLVPGYYVGGKTGTAQIWDPTLNHGKGDWKHNIFNYSFVGFIGKTAPRLIVAVQIREGTPTINVQGHIEMPEMSFELFRRIATDAITTLDLPAPAKPKIGPTLPVPGTVSDGGSSGATAAPTPDPMPKSTPPAVRDAAPGDPAAPSGATDAPTATATAPAAGPTVPPSDRPRTAPLPSLQNAAAVSSPFPSQ